MNDVAEHMEILSNFYLLVINFLQVGQLSSSWEHENDSKSQLFFFFPPTKKLQSMTCKPESKLSSSKCIVKCKNCWDFFSQLVEWREIIYSWLSQDLQLAALPRAKKAVKEITFAAAGTCTSSWSLLRMIIWVWVEDKRFGEIKFSMLYWSCGSLSALTSIYIQLAAIRLLVPSAKKQLWSE